MIPVRVIGFKANGLDGFGEDYDCSFMLSFPHRANIPENEVNSAMQLAITQFQEYHPKGNITAKMEKVVLARRG